MTDYPTDAEMAAADPFEAAVLHRIVPAATAAPLGVPALAHGWIPSLEGVRLDHPAAEPVTADAPLGLNWTSPAPRAVDPALRERLLAHLRTLRPERLASAQSLARAVDVQEHELEFVLEEMLRDGAVAMERRGTGTAWGLWHPALRQLGAPPPVSGDDVDLAPHVHAQLPARAARACAAPRSPAADAPPGYSRKGRKLLAFFDRVLGGEGAEP